MDDKQKEEYKKLMENLPVLDERNELIGKTSNVKIDGNYLYGEIIPCNISNWR